MVSLLHAADWYVTVYDLFPFCDVKCNNQTVDTELKVTKLTCDMTAAIIGALMSVQLLPLP